MVHKMVDFASRGNMSMWAVTVPCTAAQLQNGFARFCLRQKSAGHCVPARCVCTCRLVLMMEPTTIAGALLGAVANKVWPPANNIPPSPAASGPWGAMAATCIAEPCRRVCRSLALACCSVVVCACSGCHRSVTQWLAIVASLSVPLPVACAADPAQPHHHLPAGTGAHTDGPEAVHQGPAHLQKRDTTACSRQSRH